MQYARIGLINRDYELLKLFSEAEKNSAPPRLCGKNKTNNFVIKMTENEIGTKVIESAINVHRELGPGLLESVYEIVLCRELEDQGLKIKRQVPVPIHYRGIKFDEGFRADIIVENKVILELKSVEKVSGMHKKQLQTYLKLTGCKLGYLLNFSEELMKTGITRCVNGFKD